MQFFDSNSAESPPEIARPRHELLIEILKFLTPVLALISSLVALRGKYPWLSKPWVFDALVALSVFVLIWFAKPRFVSWLQGVRDSQHERRFIASNDTRLRELLARFTDFTSSSDIRSLIYILRSAYPQNQVLEQILAGDYIGTWIACFHGQMAFPARSLHQFLGQCREFTCIVQEFNTNYVLRHQRHCAVDGSFSEDHIAQMEQFREEFTALLRDIELWATGISGYLQSMAATNHASVSGIAPIIYFVRAKSFRHTTPARA
jgi:hypothetical protein